MDGGTALLLALYMLAPLLVIGGCVVCFIRAWHHWPQESTTTDDWYWWWW